VSQPFRLPAGGRIDRGRRLAFRFDGRSFEGHPGDTLASALLANGVRLLGRSFKYHRPRGLLGVGSEEPNALVELGGGGRREPNSRATTAELFEGLQARSQNRHPSLRLDLLSLLGLFDRFLVAGFYYKTFMWPSALWERLYERVIRRGAGLGRAAEAPDPDGYELRHAHCDVAVVGGGPAGLAAALAAGSGGARVVLMEEAPWVGGQLAYAAAEDPALAAAVATLRTRPETTVLTRTTAFGLYDGGTLGAVERVADHVAAPREGEPRQRLWVLHARRIVFCTGATERPLVFAGNDLPGVLLAGAAAAYVNRFAAAPGRRAVVATNNDSAYGTARDLAAAGVQVAAVLDARADPVPVAAAAERDGLRVLAGSLPRRASGWQALRWLDVQDRQGRAVERIACDTLAMSGGWTPNVHLPCQVGASPAWRDDIAAFVPPAALDDRLAGAVRGSFAAADCAAEGHAAGMAAARALGLTGESPPLVLRAEPPGGGAPIETVWRCPGPGKAFVDFQNDVTADDLLLAQREGYDSVELMKRYTTLGMATDQGRSSNVNGLALLAAARGQPIAAVGTTRYRPPYTPVALGAFAGRERGVALKPTRRTALHEVQAEAGAVFVESGLWLRASHFPIGAEDVAAATFREAEAVRRDVGLCDVSTLGKIEVFGPDAETFLDRLYANRIAGLASGRARYGLLLREDGIAFDDGTVLRLADDSFLVTTTTARAPEVMAHFEFFAQAVWPELDVALCSATEQLAGLAVAGPKSRALLKPLLQDADLDALPFMGHAGARIAGVAGRIARISFSGELAYELLLPADEAAAVWLALRDAGQALGCAPYGIEAMNVLRIEKGHPTASEIDGRSTAADLGFGRLLSPRKRFVGDSLAHRPAFRDPDRPALVGLRCLDPQDRLRSGAHLCADAAAVTAESSLGWITSAARSPAAGRWIALAYLRGGQSRHGQRIAVVDPLRGEPVAAEVCAPCFVDPEGVRLRA